MKSTLQQSGTFRIGSREGSIIEYRSLSTERAKQHSSQNRHKYHSQMKIEDMDYRRNDHSKSVTSKEIQEEYRRVKNMLMQHKKKGLPLRNP